MKKMKYISITAILLFTLFINSVYAQKYIEKKGQIIFEASEKLFEPVKAENNAVTAILDIETNQIAGLALIKGFHFKNSLMEEHFNENYIESETYPKATFKGKLLNFDASILTKNSLEVMIEGKLKLHGKEKEIRTPLSIQKINDILILKGSFKVVPADFDIEIPSIVRNKIAKEIIVQLEFNLRKK